MFSHLLRLCLLCIGTVVTGVLVFDSSTALAAAPTAPTTQPVAQVVIDDFQVTQGIQTTANDVALIKDRHGNYKPMVVRIAAHSTLSEPLTVTVRSHLEFHRLSSPTSHTRSIGPTRVVLSNTVHGLDGAGSITQDVVLSQHLVISEAVSLTAWVEIFSIPPSVQLLSRSPEKIYTIRPTYTPQIFFYPVKFPEETRAATATISSTIAAGFVKGVFPVFDSIDLYRSVPYPTFTCPVPDAYGNKLIDEEHEYVTDTSNINIPAERCTIFHHLAVLRHGLATCGFGPDPYTFVYGWIKDNPIPVNGYGSQSGRVAFGNTEAERGQRTFAHELTHNLGFVHDDTKLTDTVGWDVGGRLLTTGGFWTNTVTSSLKSAQLFDVRASGKKTHEAWIAADTYNSLMQNLAITGIPAPITPNPSCLTTGQWQTILGTTYTQDYCIAAQSDGTYLAYPFPATAWQWSLQPISSAREGLFTAMSLQPIINAQEELFTVQFGTQSGQIISARYDGRVGTDPENPEQDILYGFLSASVPYTATFGQVTFAQIIDPNGRVVPIYDRANQQYTTALENRYTTTPFRIAITSPVLPAEFVTATSVITTATFTVAWTVVQSEPQRVQNFEFQVLYSHDGGRIWTPLAVNLPGNILAVTINREELCTTADQVNAGETGILRVVGSDGFNVDSDEVRVSLIGAVLSYCQRGTIREEDLPPPPSQINVQL